MPLRDSAFPSLAAHLAARASSAPAPASGTVPAWRREELPPAQARALLGEEGVPYDFELERPGITPLRLMESHAFVGTRVWDAAVVLARCMERMSSQGRLLLEGRRVVELGAGTGLVGLVAARLGARVLLTDVAALVPGLRGAIDANGLAGTTTAAPLLWGCEADAASVLATLRGEGGEARSGLLLIASDMAAPEREVPAFMATLARLMPPMEAGVEGKPCLLLCTQRHRDFTAPLLAALSEVYRLAAVPADALHPHFITARHNVWLVRTKEGGPGVD